MANCPKCGRRARGKNHLCAGCKARRKAPKLMASEPEYDADQGCNGCPYRTVCEERLKLSPAAWVACEIPDEWDLQVAEALEFPFVELEASQGRL